MAWRALLQCAVRRASQPFENLEFHLSYRTDGEHLVGGFYLVTASALPERRADVIHKMDLSFRGQGLEPANRVEFGGHVLQTFRKRGQSSGGEVYRAPNRPEHFAAACGSLAIEGKTGLAALVALAGDNPPDPAGTAAVGSFCILRNDERGLRLQCDPLGLMQVFRDEAGTLWSSSFLALASATTERRFNRQAVFEYIFAEMPHGRETIAAHIQLHDCRKTAHWQPDLRLIDTYPTLPSEPNRSPAALEQACVDALLAGFQSLSDAFAGRIDSGLSGGYDSRLVLAALRKAGAEPRLHVYGAANSDDVLIAKEIAARARMEIHHIDKGKREFPSPEEYRVKAIEWLLAFDGYVPDGVMGNGQDIATRIDRAAGGRAALNGGGGEIFRNFFYLPNRRYTRREVLWSFYSQFDARVAQPGFDLDDYYQRMESKLADCVGHMSNVLSRREVEWLYTAFRCRFWMARNNCINSRLGAYFTPLVTWRLATLGLDIPMAEKNLGVFESRLIRALAPDLATIRTAYGHDLSGPIPWRRKAKDMLTLIRPVRLRRWSFTAQSRLADRRGVAPPAWLPYAKRAVEPGLPRMSQYFQIGKLTHPGQLNRAYTLELLGEYLGMD